MLRRKTHNFITVAFGIFSLFSPVSPETWKCVKKKILKNVLPKVNESKTNSGFVTYENRFCVCFFRVFLRKTYPPGDVKHRISLLWPNLIYVFHILMKSKQDFGDINLSTDNAYQVLNLFCR